MIDQPKDEWTYLAPVGPGESVYKERGSSFLGRLEEAAGAEGAMGLVEQARRRYHDATHHCWAYRIGWADKLQERSSDAGEPSRTAGVPILSVMQTKGISDACLVVVRYFGGVKLGTGGLARAYRAAALTASEAARLEERTLSVRLQIALPYAAQGALRHAAAEFGVVVEESGYGQELQLEAVVPLGARVRFEQALARLNEFWKGGLAWKSK